MWQITVDKRDSFIQKTRWKKCTGIKKKAQVRHMISFLHTLDLTENRLSSGTTEIVCKKTSPLESPVIALNCPRNKVWTTGALCSPVITFAAVALCTSQRVRLPSPYPTKSRSPSWLKHMEVTCIWDLAPWEPNVSIWNITLLFKDLNQKRLIITKVGNREWTKIKILDYEVILQFKVSQHVKYLSVKIRERHWQRAYNLRSI